jgi:hypothetical protein
MTAQPVLEPLIAAGLTVAVRPDGSLAISPSQRITPLLDAHVRAHRDELMAALSAVPAPARQPLDWPTEHQWFAAWMEKDDRRRAETMAAGKARLAARK